MIVVSAPAYFLLSMSKKAVSLALVGSLLFLTASATQAAGLSVVPDTKTVKVNDTFDVTIELSLDGESINGVDALLNFNKTYLQVTTITNGTVFAEVIKHFDNGDGTISVSGLSATTPITADGTLATITFKAKAKGTSTLNFDYTAGSKIDSNVTEYQTNKELLDSVINGSYIVQDSAASALSNNEESTASAGIGGAGSDTEPTPSLPKAGNALPLILVLTFGVAFIGAGWLIQLRWRVSKITANF